MTTENTINGIALIEIKETEEATENSHAMDVITPNEQVSRLPRFIIFLIYQITQSRDFSYTCL